MNTQISNGVLGTITLLAIFGLTLFVVQAVAQTNGGGGRKIVVFQTGLNEVATDEIIARAGGAKLKNLNLIGAKAVWVPDRASAAKLAASLGVARVDDDVVVSALAKGGVSAKPAKPAPTQPAEVLPWGVDQIDAEKVWGGSEDATAVVPENPSGQGIKVAIVDTGIDVKHPDLMDNLKGGVSAVGYTASYNDDNGHGTHVAGIVGAIDNTIGVIGVGPKIDLYAVKVLDRRGSGYLSDVIEGLDWAINNGMQVVNMSLGTSVYNASFEAAIKKVNAAGIVQVAAAGNSGSADNTVLYPAKFSEVIAVSATDQSDVIASWSSRGSEIDLAAPGVLINSTYKGQTYKTISGTSMAAPHVAGSAALVLSTPIGSYDTIINGKWDPDEVKTKLQVTATGLGDAGPDNLYGYGLVNAYAATR